jgi:propanol-preferring alcohol dehydrogenase
VIEQVGAQISRFGTGDRVCVHYMVTCGACHYCNIGQEQFCAHGQMIGKHRDGGYAEYIAVPERSAILLPDEISFEHGAAMMCSTATAFHAMVKSRLKAGEAVAIFGAGGLGMSAIQIARAFGALDVYAVDIREEKLDLAERLGAIPIDAQKHDPLVEILRRTDGKGVDVALELVGLPLTMQQAVRSLSVFGRAVIVGITDKPLEINSYTEVLGKETEIIGSSDHLMSELPLLFEFARRGALDLTDVVSRTVPLDAEAINRVLDALDEFAGDVRAVIVP